LTVWHNQRMPARSAANWELHAHSVPPPTTCSFPVSCGSWVSGWTRFWRGSLDYMVLALVPGAS
jgi:hypothetical protein